MKRKVNPAVVERARKRVAEAGRAAAQSVGKGIRSAIRVAAEYAEHLHKEDKVPKETAIKKAARAVLNTVRKRG
jgi:hypothetical protein